MAKLFSQIPALLREASAECIHIVSRPCFGLFKKHAARITPSAPTRTLAPHSSISLIHFTTRHPSTHRTTTEIEAAPANSRRLMHSDDTTAPHAAAVHQPAPQTPGGSTRREFVTQMSACTAGLWSTQLLAQQQPASPPDAPAFTGPGTTIKMSLTVNGQPCDLEVDTRTTLLDALREHLHLTGSKKGCDQGQCGACTVMVDGRRIVSCLTLAVMQQHHEVTTIEGLGTPDHMHPMQAAFVKHDGFQCGYCTPGQICSAVAVLQEIKDGIPSHVTADLTARPHLTSAELRERMSGNLCRCGAYSNIAEAITEVAKEGVV